MNQAIPRKKYWPYDELKISRDLYDQNKIIFDAPWLRHEFKVEPAVADKIEQVVARLYSDQVSAEDLEDIAWLLDSVKSYPFAYLLPRAENDGGDTHLITNKIDLTNPSAALKALLSDVKGSAQALKIADLFQSIDWTWDTEAVLQFSRTATGHDPESIFSICRRFHLLNDIENNKTADLLNYLKESKESAKNFNWNNALVIRQNHYITQECEDVVSASLPLSQTARSEVLEFIDAEAGHDKILDIAMKSMGLAADEVPVINSTYALMGLFKKIAQINFLAFAMTVDVFERSSYLNEDPFAKVLKEGGSHKAAHQLDAHRHINEAGGHENVAIGFLKTMKPVSVEYTEQAIRLAELLTLVIHVVSKETLDNMKNEA